MLRQRVRRWKGNSTEYEITWESVRIFKKRVKYFLKVQIDSSLPKIFKFYSSSTIGLWMHEWRDVNVAASLWGKAEQTDRAGHVHPLIPLTHIDVYYIDCDGQLVLEPLESEEMCMEKKLTSSPRVNQAETVVFKLFDITIELCVNPSFTQLRRASTIKKNQ